MWVNLVIGGMLLIHIAVWAAGHFTSKLLLYVSGLNLLVGFSVILYWLLRIIRVSAPVIYKQELIIICFELAVMGTALYFLFSGKTSSRLKMLPILFFGIHFVLLISALIFMGVFKMKRLI